MIQFKSAMYKIIISLGSNSYSKLNIDKAKRMLSFSFPDIIFSRSLISLSDDGANGVAPFRNAVALLQSDIPIKELMRRLKSIEFALGRQPKDKEIGKIVIDLDLLQYGDVFVREDDINKDYIQTLMQDIIIIEE